MGKKQHDDRMEHSLHEVKNRHTVSDRTQHRIAVWSEKYVSLPVDRAAKVRELEEQRKKDFELRAHVLTHLIVGLHLRS